MYIVISKPKRISVKSGLVHMVLTSRTIIDLLFPPGTECAGARSYCNSRAIQVAEGRTQWWLDDSRSCNGQKVFRPWVLRRMSGGIVDISQFGWLK